MGSTQLRSTAAAGFQSLRAGAEEPLAPQERRLWDLRCFRFWWAAAATVLLVVGLLEVKSAFGFPALFTSSIGTKTATSKAEITSWEEIPGMDDIIRKAQGLRPPPALRNLGDLFYDNAPKELPWVRTECVIDTIQATAYLGQAVVFLYKAIDYEGIKCPNNSPSGCAASVAGFVTSITWVATYLTLAANACAQAVNSEAICVADFTALMADFGEIATAGAAVKEDCQSSFTAADLFLPEPDATATHAWAQFIPAAAAPTAELVAGIKYHRSQSRNRAFDITQCVMDATNMLSFIVRALLQVRVAAAACPVPQACSIEIMNVISTFAWIARFSALAISDCSVQGNSKALCAADISNMIAALSNGPAAGVATTSDCADVHVVEDLAEVEVRPTSRPPPPASSIPELPAVLSAS